MGHAPYLTCLRQESAPISPHERAILDIPDSQIVHVREITMGEKNNLWLFARTIIPITTLVGKAKRLANIDSTPLGKLLFGSLGAIRENLDLSTIYAKEADLYNYNIPTNFPLWQRRSKFNIQTGPIFIQEIFLPGCPLYDDFERATG